MSNLESFTLLIPFYNPTLGWEKKVEERYLEFSEAIAYKIPLVLINDGSKTDITRELEYLQKRLGSILQYISYETNLGKGAALKFGASNVISSKYIFTDIDFPYDLKSMVKIYETCKDNSGIIVGTRDQGYYHEISKTRKILSKGLRWLNTNILRLPVNDTQCGLKAFDSEVKEILLRCTTDRFLIDLELLLAISNTDINIKTVYVQQRGELDLTKFNSSIIIKEARNFFKLLWKYRIMGG